MIKLLKQIGQDTRGATAVEYGLILALVFIAILAGVSAFGQQTIAMWDRVATEIDTAING